VSERRLVGAALLAAALVFASVVPAQSVLAPGTPAAMNTTPDAAGPSLMRVGAALLAVLALLLGIHAALRRTSSAGSGRVLRIETRLPVARGGHVAVVRVDGRRLLVGVTPTSVNLITELGCEEAAVEATSVGRFDFLLAGLLRRKAGSE
jgi:flagellar protein FliO/FliZ